MGLSGVRNEVGTNGSQRLWLRRPLLPVASRCSPSFLDFKPGDVLLLSLRPIAVRSGFLPVLVFFSISSVSSKTHRIAVAWIVFDETDFEAGVASDDPRRLTLEFLVHQPLQSRFGWHQAC